MTTPGTVTATIAAGVAKDTAGNDNLASTSTDNTVAWDNVPPTVTINQAALQADPTKTSPINFTVVFSKSVTGFATGDVTFTGSTAGGAKTGTVTGSGTTYNVAVTGMTGVRDGRSPSIAAGVATDTAGNGNAASTSTDNSVTFDNVPPTVTINQAAGQADPTNAATINFTVTFSEAVTGFATGDVTFTGSTAGGTLTGTVTGGPTIYNVAVTGMTGSGTVDRHDPCRCRDRPRGQQQRRLDIDRQLGHLGQRRPDRHDQPGGRPGGSRRTAPPSTSRSCSARPSRASRRAT